MEKKINWLLKRLSPNAATEEIVRSKSTVKILRFIQESFHQLDPITKHQMIMFIENNIVNLDFLREYFFENQKQEFFADLVHSTTCPLCERHAKIYKRKLSSNSVKFLTSLIVEYYRSEQATGKKGPVHYKDCNFGSRDYPALRWWGLAATYKDQDDSKNWSGYWVPTEKGLAFARAEVTIPKYLYTYNGAVMDMVDEEDVSPALWITDIIGEKFNYAELMAPIVDEYGELE